MKICFHCDKEILPEESKFLLGLEVPYCNLWFHRACYKEIDDLKVYFYGLYDKVMDYITKKRDIIRKK